VTLPGSEIVTNVATASNFGTASFDFSAGGTLIYASAPPDPPRYRVLRVDRRNNRETLLESSQPILQISASPDGTRLVMCKSGANDAIYLYDIKRKTQKKLSSIPGDAAYPCWTPDGASITFATTLPPGLVSIAADFSGKEVRLISGSSKEPMADYFSSLSWFPKRETPLLAFAQLNQQTRNDIWILSAGADAKPTAVVNTHADEGEPCFSPDGRWLAYTSFDSPGPSEILIRSFPGPGGAVPVSTEGGRVARWSPNGRELFYRQGTKVMAVPLEIGSTIKPGMPTVIVDDKYLSQYDVTYDVMPDGSLVLVEAPEIPPTTHLNLVLNWFEELKRLCPTGKK
jgi:Tol biopolymer transport system component